MKRDIFETTATCESIDLTNFASDPAGCLSRQMQTHKLNYLLAHADDGVIWGRKLDGEELLTSYEVAPEYSPPLRTETLQTVRVFGPAGELLVWRDEIGAWAGRLIAEPETAQDTPSVWELAFEEEQILLGTKTEQRARDFTLMSEGTQGLIHIVPIKVTEQINEEHRPLRLVVRHYVKADDHGFLQVHASRLHSLHLKTKESNP